MEWIETTGKTVNQAIALALEQLGVDASELEYEVVQEPRTGFLGRIGAVEARIRARVRPVSREKPEHRRRERRGRPPREQVRSGRGRAGAEASERRRAAPQRKRRAPARGTSAPTSEAQEHAVHDEPNQERPMTDTVPIEQQVEVAEEFTAGLVRTLGLVGEVRARPGDDGDVEVEVVGDDLGLLIGAQARTLHAVEELVRTALQHRTEGHSSRVSLDVAGYRQERRRALEEFARTVAEQVRSTGRARALEPMSAADRKIVHDAVTELDGVTTASEGEEPRRRVVIQPI